MIRSDLKADGDRCTRCYRTLADAQLHRVIAEHGVDVIALCRGCGQPTVIPWSREAA